MSEDKNNNKIKLKDVSDSIINLHDFLIKKAQNHNCYKFYSTLDKIKYCVETSSLFLSTGKKWNDVIDRENFNNEKNRFTNFGICFSFSKSENVAMWMLYGGLQKNGAMLNLSRSMLLNKCGIHCLDIELGYFDNNIFICKKVISYHNYEIKLIDVLYVGKTELNYSIKRSDERVDEVKLNLDSFPEIIQKSFSWSYENEVRMIISIDKQLLKDINEEVDTVRWHFPDEKNANSLKNSVVLSPNNLANEFKKSSLSKDLDWDLCSHCSYKKEI